MYGKCGPEIKIVKDSYGILLKFCKVINYFKFVFADILSLYVLLHFIKNFCNDIYSQLMFLNNHIE